MCQTSFFNIEQNSSVMDCNHCFLSGPKAAYSTRNSTVHLISGFSLVIWFFLGLSGFPVRTFVLVGASSKLQLWELKFHLELELCSHQSQRRKVVICMLAGHIHYGIRGNFRQNVLLNSSISFRVWFFATLLNDHQCSIFYSSTPDFSFDILLDIHSKTI